MTGWQDMSTAPLDERIEVFWSHGVAGVALWSDYHEEFVDNWGKPVSYPDGWRPLGGTP